MTPDDVQSRLHNTRLQDTLVVVVGTGEKVWELADRRVQERGRLLVLITERAPACTYVDGGDFKWCPPQREKVTGQQGLQMVRKYKAGASRRWIRKGPDIIELKEDEKYEMDEGGSSLRVLSATGDMKWEVSAKVLLAHEVEDVAAESLAVTSGFFCAVPTPGFAASLSWMVFYLLFMTIMITVNSRYEVVDDLPYARMLFVAVAGAVYASSVANNVGGAAVGIENTSTKVIVQHFSIGWVAFFSVGIIPFGSNTLTTFVTAAVVTGILYSILLPHHFYNVGQPNFVLKPGEARPELVRVLGIDFAWPSNWKWCVIVVHLALGGWIQFYAIGLAYIIGIGAGYDNVANVALPLVVTAVEGAISLAAQMAYGRFVFKHRSSGNHMYIVVMILCSTHAFAESVKGASMVSGSAICVDNPNGLKWPDEGSCNPYGWVVGACTGIVVTLLGRFGWSRFLVCRLLNKFGLKKLAKKIAPSIVSKLHDEVKYNFGYPRFIVAFAVLLSNVVLGKDPVIFNLPATWCCVASFLIETVEDVLVGKEVFPYPPAPNPTMYMGYNNFDPRQLYAFVTSPQEELTNRKSRSSGRRRSSGSGSLTARTSIFRTDGDFFPRALPLHGTRDMTPFEQAYAMTVSCFFTLCLYQLLLGAGYFWGVCKFPLSKGDRLKEAILWPIPLNVCDYSN